MEIEVRRAVYDDIAAWAEMRHQFWPDTSVEEHRAELEQALIDQTQAAYLAVCDNASVGFAEISIRSYANGSTQQPVPFLEGIWIEPDYRQKSIGRQLVRAIEEDLKMRGYVEICSDSGLENIQSQKAHLTWGFEETERVVYYRKAL
ncbi:aminoglycoside 6'-N-acetyltransferase [Terriglobus tenax]|uniref:aminoglycoside 6'-N-acetyltransferase n=1 Tax=Terriglobus tenax TaxID=1111115 RepID=UPI0021E0D15C|nr:aminoglycoside 6'-N-acetyltransferase [Terriglobus tenax]